MTRSRTAGLIAAGVVTAAIGLSLAGQGVALASTDTVTNCNSSGPGSLPAVVASAAAGDTITFAPSPSCDLITLTSTLTINKSLIITGPGAAAMAVSGGGTVGVFSISSGAVVGISGLTIENGSSTFGGGIDNSGGIVTLTDSAVLDNTTATAVNGSGGGINNNSGSGSMTITDSIISGNSTNSTQGDGAGGGITNNFGSSMTITDSTVSDNTSPLGGGIINQGSMTITGSTVSDNTANGGAGGGIYANQGPGPVIITDSTISGNTAGVGGGGGINDGASPVTLTDSTVSGNNAAGPGGGIAGGPMTVGATIVAGNTSGGGGVGGGDQNCSGGITSAGYNLTDSPTGGLCGFTQPTDLVNTNPQLGPLGSNGGPTQTMLPAAGSPAVGVIPPGTTLNGVPVCPRTDQRGVASAPGGNCTIGAVEIPTPPAANTVTVTNPGSQTGTVGTAVSLQMSATDSQAGQTLTWTAAGLPAGLSINSGTGLISGTATTAGSSNVTVTAQDTTGASGSASFTWTINPQPPPACPSGTKANFRWHYTANGSAGGWSGTKTEPCPGSFSMGPQAMEGNLQVAPGTTLAAGYDFTLPGNHNTLTMTVSAAQVTFAVACVSGATPSSATLTVTLTNQTYQITNDQWYPSGDQSSPLVYQGSVTVPNLCGGGKISLAKGGTFTATLG